MVRTKNSVRRVCGRFHTKTLRPLSAELLYPGRLVAIQSDAMANAGMGGNIAYNGVCCNCRQFAIELPSDWVPTAVSSYVNCRQLACHLPSVRVSSAVSSYSNCRQLKICARWQVENGCRPGDCRVSILPQCALTGGRHADGGYVGIGVPFGFSLLCRTDFRVGRHKLPKL